MSDQSTAQLQDFGRKLLTSFYGALQALKLYPVENTAVQQSLNELHDLTTTLLESEGTVELRVVGDFFFLNETRLRLDFSNFSTFGSFAQALSEHGIGAVDVHSGLGREEWSPFLSLLLRKGGGEDAYEAFTARLEGTPVRHIEVRPEKDVHQPELAQEEVMAAAKRTYAQSVKVAKDVLGDMRMGRAVTARKVKRAVQNIVDQVLSNEPSIITMTTLKEFDEYTFTHCVNVCIFSVVIGQRLGLDKLQLYDLGLGALLHDIGKMRVATEVINKPGGLTDAEWAELREHPTEGLLILFQMQGFSDVPYRQMLLAYEHHMKVDLTGYPVNRRSRTPTLFSRIVAVADGFDAGTSIRSYQYTPWPPDEVLKEMRDNPAARLRSAAGEGADHRDRRVPDRHLGHPGHVRAGGGVRGAQGAGTPPPPDGQGDLRRDGRAPSRSAYHRPVGDGRRPAAPADREDDRSSEVRDPRLRLPYVEWRPRPRPVGDHRRSLGTRPGSRRSRAGSRSGQHRGAPCSCPT